MMSTMQGNETNMQDQQAEAEAILAVIEPRRSESVKQALVKAAKPSTNKRSEIAKQPASGGSKSKHRSTS